jgi:hypothetical protein
VAEANSVNDITYSPPRSDLYDAGQSGESAFYDPDNPAGLSSRKLAAEECMTAMVHFLVNQNGKVAIFDATNSVRSRRQRIMERFNGVATVVFVEVLCDDQEILEENILVKVRTSPDFRGKELNEAVADMRERVRMYEKAYQPIMDDSLSYIKLFNLSSKVCFFFGVIWFLFVVFGFVFCVLFCLPVYLFYVSM